MSKRHVSNLYPKQDTFCRAYVELGNASEAHRRAGYGPNMSNKTRHEAACRLLANSKILARIKALQSEHRARHDVTVDQLTDELEIARQQAMKLGQISAAVRAIIGKAKLHGLIPAKHYASVDVDVRTLDDETLTAEIERLLAGESISHQRSSNNRSSGELTPEE